MRRWPRILISGLIALLVFAATYPSVFLASGGTSVGAFLYILALAFIPFAMICAFAGRNTTIEVVGWAGHFITLAAVVLT